MKNIEMHRNELEIIEIPPAYGIEYEGYQETEVCFLNGNRQVLYGTYTLSEDDKCAVEYINKELEKRRKNLENKRMEAVLKQWTIPDNPRRKKRIEPSNTARPVTRRLSLLDISLIAVQVTFALMALLRW